MTTAAPTPPSPPDPLARDEVTALARAWRLLLVLIAGALLFYGLVYERHRVVSLSGGNTREFSGPAYVEGATYDQFARAQNQLVAPLSPLATQEKDCKT